MKRRKGAGPGRPVQPRARFEAWYIAGSVAAIAVAAVLYGKWSSDAPSSEQVAQSSANGLNAHSRDSSDALRSATDAHNLRDSPLEPVVAIRSEETLDPVPYPGAADVDTSDSSRPALQWLLQPVAPKDWEETHWDGLPLLLKRPSDFYGGLQSGLRAVDALLHVHKTESRKPLLMHPTEPRTQADCSIVKGGMDDLTPKYTSVHHGYLDGGTVVCNLAAAYWPPLAKLMRDLSAGAGFDFLANMYLTPPHSAGFTAHTDNKDGFILQIEGQKHWRVWEPLSLRRPLRSQMLGRPHEAPAEKGPIVFDGVVTAGDLLFVPRGYVHQAAAAGDKASLHFTVSAAKNLEWSTLLPNVFQGYPRDRLPQHVLKLVTGTLGEAVRAEAAQVDQSWVRGSLPLGYGSPSAALRAKVRDVLTQLKEVMLKRLAKQLAKQPAGKIAFSQAFTELIEGPDDALDAALSAAVAANDVYLNYTSNLVANGESVAWPPAGGLEPGTTVIRVEPFDVANDGKQLAVTTANGGTVRLRTLVPTAAALDWVRERDVPFKVAEIGGGLDDFGAVCVVRILEHLGVVSVRNTAS